MATKKKAAKPARQRRFSRSSLIAEATTTSRLANVTINFFNGIGQVTASLFRKGILINMQSIATDGIIQFNDVQSGDTMSINGICTNRASLTISLPTHPATPDDFSKGAIVRGYLFL
ncbi:MAG TPA: hypothetical protein V6C58_14860 [Allocoleopsis sp.]